MEVQRDDEAPDPEHERFSRCGQRLPRRGVVAAGGQKRDIRGNAVFQRYLLGEHRRGGGSLCLTLDVPQPSDYMDVVCWYIGE